MGILKQAHLEKEGVLKEKKELCSLCHVDPSPDPLYVIKSQLVCLDCVWGKTEDPLKPG